MTTSHTYATPSPEKLVETVIDELTKAMLHPDKQKLDKLISENVSYGHSAGLVQNKAEIIDNLVNGPFKFLTIDIADQTIKVVSDVAITRQTMNVDYIENGVNGKYKFGILLIWHLENQQWKLFARQAIKL